MAQVKDLLVKGQAKFLRKVYFQDQIVSNVAQGTAPLVVASSTVVSNLNSDYLDGYHASGLFTALSANSTLSITIGGTTLTSSINAATVDGKYISNYYTKSEADDRFVNVAGDTMTGALTIKGVTDSGQCSQGGFNKAYANIILQGDNTYGVSGIVFKSMKANDTNINTPSDVAFIQYHPYGVTAAAYNTTPTEASSGEKGRLVIGIGNDTGAEYGEELWLQTAGANDLKHYVVNTGYTIWDAGNDGSGSGLDADKLDGYHFSDIEDRYVNVTGDTMTGNLSFSNSGTEFRGINYGTMGDNDQWRIGGAATGSNSGYMEIATADDGTEPIYVRQYSGVFGSLVRTLALLDGSGNTTIPGNVGIGTTNPRAKLDVGGYDSSVIIGKTNGSPGGSAARKLRLGLATVGHTGSQYWTFSVDDTTNNSYLQIAYTESDTGLSLRHDGYLGIGTRTPSNRLHVSGDNGVKIEGDSGGPYLTVNYNNRYDSDNSLDNYGINLIKFGKSSMDNYLGTGLNTGYSGYFGRQSYVFHTGSSYAFGWYSSGWNCLMELQGATGNLWTKGMVYSDYLHSRGNLYVQGTSYFGRDSYGDTYYINGPNYTGTSAYANALASQGIVTAMSGTSRYSYGLRFGKIYNSGYPFSYGNTITIENGGFGSEIIFNGIGGGGATGSGEMKFRTHSDWDSSEWGNWRTVIDSTNIGSQSVSYASSTGYVVGGYIYNLNEPSTWSSDGARLILDQYNLPASNQPVSVDNANSLVTFFKTKHGTSGQYASQLAFPDHNRFYFRYAAAGSWSAWYTVAFTSDIPSSLPANGGNADSVTIHYDDNSNSTYQMLWGSGNSVYGTGGIYCNPYSDCIYASHYYETSDIRLKTDFENLNVSINSIASLPVFDFSWKDKIKNRNTGTSAQAVQAIFPNIVTESNNTLKLDYGVLGTASSIIIAREVLRLKEEIRQLKQKLGIIE